jgi:hypothetical protein
MHPANDGVADSRKDNWCFTVLAFTAAVDDPERTSNLWGYVVGHTPPLAEQRDPGPPHAARNFVIICLVQSRR